MSRYDDLVLNMLLDSYENSAAYAEEHSTKREQCGHVRSRRRGIFCRIDRKKFPAYFDTASDDYQVLHQQLQELERKGLIRLYWKDDRKGHILEKAALIQGREEECYRLLHRSPRWRKEARIGSICRRFETEAERIRSAEPLTCFLSWIMDRLEDGSSIRQYVDLDDPDAFERLCRLLLAVLTNEQDIYLREFSTVVFHDSKIAERELERAASVIRSFSSGENDAANLHTDEIMEMYGVYRNPVWIYLKGTGRFRIGSGEDCVGSVDISALENGLGLTLRDLEQLEPEHSVCPEVVLTVENLTSYYQQDSMALGRSTLVIYLGGFAGRQKREFLKRLRETYPNASFLHSGDIDCGGFRIWKALCEGTGIPFATYRMDLPTFEQFQGSGRPLTKKDCEQLRLMKEDPFFNEQCDLFDRMLESGLKLEQESFREAFSE